MKIYLTPECIEEECLYLIAQYNSCHVDSNGILDQQTQTLFQLHDDSFVVRIDKPNDPNSNEVLVDDIERTKIYRREFNPSLWLLTHGHEQLAGFMFPELKDKIESKMLSIEVL